MDKWGYQTITFPLFLDKKYTDEEFEEEMNQLGSEGWELAGTAIPTNSKALIAFFKRKIKQE